ncbi:hypothetical protein MKEN_01367000 [Mycena kentingensis (nom. inval.)]|nr:hypothetical protein MKEN_01367000 [Mycena kentingensis (nom. inval.)]
MDPKPLAKMVSTCSRCRAKKIRCDGSTPCGPCSRARIEVECSYTVVPNISHGPELRKGAACTACRRKKKKCSGDWPCRTCVASKKEDECKFNDNSQMSFTRALIERTLELEQLLSHAKSSTQPDPTYPNIATELDQMYSTHPLPAVSPVPFDPAALLRAGPAPAPLYIPEEVDYTYGSESPTSAIAEGPEEKLARLRRKFLSKRLQFGFVVPEHKLNAILSGDTSGTVVHPVLVHVCQLWGAMLDYCETNQTWTYATDKHGDEVTHMRYVLGAIAGMLGPPPDPTTTLLAYMSLSLYFFHKQDFTRGQEFLSVGCTTALQNDLDLALLASVPVNDGVASQGMYSLLPMTEADELRSVYAKMIWVAFSSKMVLGTAYAIDQRLFAAFDRIVGTRLPNNADINFQRAKSLLLLRRTRLLTSAWNSSQTAPGEWFEQYWQLIEQLHAYIGVLNPIQVRVSFLPESRTTELVLKICLSMTYTSLADLHGVFAPSHTESSKRYRDALLEIASINSGFTIEDCHHLDPILPICWSVATKRILDNQVVYENQESIIAAIRGCNQNLFQFVPLVTDFETNMNDLLSG